MVQQIALLRNIGKFDSVDAGAQLPLAKLALIYGENSRGKTTLATILRSVNTGDASLIAARKRLSSTRLPHIVLTIGGVRHVFENGSWSATHPHIAVFDDAFVAANVCSGIEIGTDHRQNLHELILGAQGVSLNQELQTHVAHVEEHNRLLRIKADAIPAATRGSLTIDAFCALPVKENIDQEIQDAERALAAAKSSETIRNAPIFRHMELPVFDVASLNELLARALPELDAEALTRVQEHLRGLGDGGEAWISDGMGRIQQDSCPFCAQDLTTSPVIKHYRAYFSAAYAALKQSIADQSRSVRLIHGGDAAAAFERMLRSETQTRDFWRAFTDVPEVNVDASEIAHTWKAARDAVLAALQEKQAAPLEPSALCSAAIDAITAYESHRADFIQTSAALEAFNPQIAVVKERAAGANVATLTADLAKLKASQSRHSAAVASLCQAYMTEQQAKVTTEAARDRARAALDEYRRTIFPAYETAINIYLRKFNAGFSIQSVGSVNNRGGSSCTYNMIINGASVPLSAADGPSFRNTLSAGDRNALALAFFFASLDQDPQLAQKIVVIDDPMTSLDEHRTLTTRQEMMRLMGRVSQLIVFSHSKPFLCALWEGTDTTLRSALMIARDGDGSNLTAWNVDRDCITEHDHRHEVVAEYIRASNPTTEREVATALRPILESFMRVAYPQNFPPGMLLGPFIEVCRQRQGTPTQILSATDAVELRAVLDYANRFHHDTNSAWQTAAINDQELLQFCERVLRFTRRA